MAATDWTPSVTVDHPPATLLGLTPGAPYQFRVRTVDTSGNKSDWAESTIFTTPTDGVPPAPPSTPIVLDTGLGTIRVTWDGKDIAAHDMVVLDFDHVQVHVGKSAGFNPCDGVQKWNGTAWIPAAGTASTVFDTLGSASSTVYVVNGDYTPFYFKFVAVDRSSNLSDPSNASVSIAASQVGVGDVASGVLSFTSFAFTDAGNLIGDGSFEQAATRSALTLPGNATFINDTNALTGAFHGGWYLRFSPGSGAVKLLDKAICHPGDEFLVRRNVRGSAGVNGLCRYVVTFYDNTNGIVSTPTLLSNPLTLGSWVGQAASIVVPAGAATMDVVIDVASGFTTGTWAVDTVEMRLKIDTLLIRDAAITNALIHDATIEFAKIVSVSAGSIIAGRMSADLGLAGRLLIGPLNLDGTLVSPTGARVEITQNGLARYDASNVKTVDINPSGADFSGTITASTFTGGVFQTDAVATNSGASNVQGVRIDSTNKNRVKFYSGHSAETAVGKIEVSADTTGSPYGVLTLQTSAFNGNQVARITMQSIPANGLGVRQVAVDGNLVLNNDLSANGQSYFADLAFFANTISVQGGVSFFYPAINVPEIRVDPGSYFDIDSGSNAAAVRVFSNSPNKGLVFDPAPSGGKPFLRGLTTGSVDSGIRWGDSAIHIRNRGDSAYIPVNASAFNVSSSRTVKTKISDLDGSAALDTVLAAPASRWQYRAGEKNAWHFGPMAEDLPADVCGPADPDGVPTADLRDLIGIEWAAIAELARRVDAIETAGQ